MSVIKDLQHIMTKRIAAAAIASTTNDVKPDTETSLKSIVENAAVDVVQEFAGSALTNVIGAGSIVKVFTAVQQLVLTLEEVKSDIQKNNPEIWAEITSAFPSLDRTVSHT